MFGAGPEAGERHGFRPGPRPLGREVSPGAASGPAGRAVSHGLPLTSLGQGPTGQGR